MRALGTLRVEPGDGLHLASALRNPREGFREAGREVDPAVGAPGSSRLSIVRVASRIDGPPPTGIFSNASSRKNPTQSPSGEKNGDAAPSVPSSSRGSNWSLRRTRSCDTPFSPTTTAASSRPSRDRASCGTSAVDSEYPSGNASVHRESGEDTVGAPGRSSHPAETPTPRRTTASAASRRRPTGVPTAPTGPAGASLASRPVSTSSRTIRASAMSCSRFFGFRSRHRRSRLPDRRRHLRRQGLEDRSPCRSTPASVSLTVSEANSRRAGEHLPQHDPEGPDVRPLVHRPAPRLLRRHVRRRPEDHPQRSSPAPATSASASASGSPHRPRAAPPGPADEAAPAGSIAFASPKSRTLTFPSMEAFTF